MAVVSVVLLLAPAPLAARASLGIYGNWGAFRDDAPARCFAIAAPVRAGAASRWRPFASVATWPGRGRRNVVFLRLSADRFEGAPVTLSIGERRFQLAGHASGVWSPDARTDLAVTAAMRGERSMSVEAVSSNGRPFADVYLLRGAATAIDAAALGCLAS